MIVRLLTSGNDWLEQKTGKPVLAVLPYLQGLYLDSEDSVAIEQHTTETKLKVVVPVYPRISNHNDLDAMRAHPQLDVELVGPQLTPNHPPADLIVLMGSKNTQADLVWFKSQGWDKTLAKHLRYGGKVLAICGGLQMLGELIDDPNGIESLSCQATKGLGYLPLTTTMTSAKELTLKKGVIEFPTQQAVQISGYEIHAGETNYQTDCIDKIVHDIDNSENTGAGFLSHDQQIFASYWHGLMDTPQALNAIITWASNGEEFDLVDYQALREQSIEALADSFDEEFDWTEYDSKLNMFFENRV